jgi:hypothetical protein
MSSESELPPVEPIILHLKPGDTLTLCTDQALSVADAGRIKAAWRARVSGTYDLVVLGSGLRPIIIRESSDEDEPA